MNTPETGGRPLSACVVIGASTGGPCALTALFDHLPLLRAGILVVQHMPKYINQSLVRSLGQHAKAEVRLAQEDDLLHDGLILIAPSETHCTLVENRRIRLTTEAEVNFVRPSVDVAMHSLAPPGEEHRLAGVLLTGMGKDGAAGMAHIKRLGGLTIAQNEGSCAVYGMPAVAVGLGCVDYQLPPERIGRLLARRLGG